MPPHDVVAKRSVKVLIADDSVFIRTLLRKIVEMDPALRIVGEASNGEEAVRMARELRPHIVVMDIEMPGMNGISATRAIHAEHGVALPVVIVSAAVKSGVEPTVEALTCGAVDFIAKTGAAADVDLSRLHSELREKVRFWAVSSLEKRRSLPGGPVPPAPSRPAGAGEARPGEIDLVVIGASTGGPVALGTLLRAMGTLPVPVVIAQHMPPEFTRSLAENLAGTLGLRVFEPAAGQDIPPGSVALLPGGRDSALRRSPWKDGAFTTVLTATTANVHPSVDTLFNSALACAEFPVAVVLTGMGCDGAEGVAAFRRGGRPVLVQDPSTATVSGMPEAAIDAGATHILSVEEIGLRIGDWVSKGKKKGSGA